MITEYIGILLLGAHYLVYQPLLSVGILLLGLELEGWGSFRARGQALFFPGLLLSSGMVGVSTWCLLRMIIWLYPVYWDGVSWALLGSLTPCYGAYVGVHVFANGIGLPYRRERRHEELAMDDLATGPRM